MTAPNTPIEMLEYPLCYPGPGCVLVRITCTTICGSDIHTHSGRRTSPVPIILGHEITGIVEAIGSGDIRDMKDTPVSIGDRITWTLTDTCGKCRFCNEPGLSMKCRHVRKYGHDRCDCPPHFKGGFAEYCFITPGTRIVKLPGALTDEAAAPANCALSTIIAGFDAACVAPLHNILIMGAGALGFYAAALASFSGMKRVIVADRSRVRLEKIKSFGATHTINTEDVTPESFVAEVKALTEGFGADRVLETAGAPSLIPLGLKSLRIGGVFAEIGCSFPDAHFTYDASDIIWRRLTLTGVHNYEPRHLQQAVDFLNQAGNRFPFSEIVTHKVSLSDVNKGLELAANEDSIRVAVLP